MNEQDLLPDSVENVIAAATPRPTNGPDTLTMDKPGRLDAKGGNDFVSGSSGKDKILGGAGNDGIYANDGKDVVIGGGGDDIAYGGQGDDVVKGGGGDDVLFGADYGLGFANSGDDRLFGGAGDDLIFGGDGDDLLKGGRGGDELAGDDGNDRLFGQGGKDRLTAGGGKDQMTGGGGRDLFHFSELASGRNIVRDWKDGTDRFEIDFDGVGFSDLDFAKKGSDVKVTIGDTGVSFFVDDARPGDFDKGDFLFSAG